MGRTRPGWISARKATTIFCVVFVGITLLQSMAYYEQWRREEEGRKQDESQAVVAELRKLRAGLEGAESAVRGYVITGTARSRDGYESAQAELRGTLEEMKQAAAPPTARAAYEGFVQRAQQELAELDKVVALRRNNGFAAAAAELGQGDVQQWSQTFRGEIAALHQNAEARLALHTAEEARRIGNYTRLFVVVTVVDFLLLGLGYWGINRYAAYRRQAEAALARAWKEAEGANLAKDRVLHTVSHDLRTPLNGVMLWAEILKRGDPKNAEAAEAIQRYAEAQTRLVNDLLDVSRMERGALRVELSDVALADVVRAAVEALGPPAAERQVRLEVDAELDGVHVMGDAFRLEQVFWNLISNAIKFTPPGGEVRVCGGVREMAEVEVRDSGRGIRAEFLPRVFEAFSQDEMVGRQGLGLGLAIVKNLVEAHGGSVVAESDGEGKGARFVVRVPVAGVDAVVREVERSGTVVG